jgi:hypothetical protein
MTRFRYEGRTYQTRNHFTVGKVTWFYLLDKRKYLQIRKWWKGQNPPTPINYLETSTQPRGARVITATTIIE